MKTILTLAVLFLAGCASSISPSDVKVTDNEELLTGCKELMVVGNTFSLTPGAALRELVVAHGGDTFLLKSPTRELRKIVYVTGDVELYRMKYVDTLNFWGSVYDCSGVDPRQPVPVRAK